MPEIAEHNTVTYTPFHPQDEFLYATEKEVFYGGAAMGGKSFCLLMLCAGLVKKYPGINIMVVRKTLPELEKGDGLIPRSKRLFLDAKWSEQKKSWTWQNTSSVEFVYISRDDECEKIQGGEWQVACIDEATNLSEYIIDFIKTRLRSTNEIPVLLRMTGNPGGISHGYFKKYFIDPSGNKSGTWDFKYKDGSTVSRRFIRATVEDNPFASEDYKSSLRNAEESFSKRFYDGCWDFNEGQYFTEWNPNVHVRRVEIKQEALKIRCIDDGFRAPFCCLWLQVDHKGTVEVYRELYRAGLNSSDQGRLMSEMSIEDVAYTVADPSADAKKPGIERTPFDFWADYGIVAEKAPNERVRRWRYVRELLAGSNTFFVDPSCENLIRTFPMATFDRHNDEDLDSSGEDHALDALGYGIANLWIWGRERKKPIHDDKFMRRLMGSGHDKEYSPEFVRNMTPHGSWEVGQWN